MKNTYIKTDKERLEYLNKELNTNYTSLDEVDWDWISANQTLSEDFIREFQDKVNWEYIFRTQKLSEKFRREFKNKINWNSFIYF